MSIGKIIALAIFAFICLPVSMGNNGLASLAMIGLVLSSLVLYFSPAWVAFSNDHNNAMAIAILNFFLGWTLVGWVGALVWAYAKKPA